MQPEQEDESENDLTQDEIQDALEQAVSEAKDAVKSEDESEPVDELTQLQEENGGLKEQLLRTAAELENVRKRSKRELEETAKYASSGIAKDLLEVLENLQRAVSCVEEDARKADPKLDTLAQGVEMTLKSMLTAFEKHGIIRIEPKGEKFDHNFHQAITQVEDPGAEPGTILEVLQAGYVMHDRLLRPAMVAVAKKAEAKKVDTQA